MSQAIDYCYTRLGKIKDVKVINNGSGENCLTGGFAGSAYGTITNCYANGYDGNSNIKTVTDANGTSTYNYDSLNRLIQILKPDGQTISYTYDARGNRIAAVGNVPAVDEAEANYSFNALDQLTGVTKSGQTTSYTYDPTGLRLKKTTASGMVYSTTKN